MSIKGSERLRPRCRISGLPLEPLNCDSGLPAPRWCPISNEACGSVIPLLPSLVESSGERPFEDMPEIVGEVIVCGVDPAEYPPPLDSRSWDLRCTSHIIPYTCEQE